MDAAKVESSQLKYCEFDPDSPFKITNNGLQYRNATESGHDHTGTSNKAQRAGNDN